MPTTRRAKASDKQGVCKKLVPLLKKRYPGGVPKSDRTVLRTILYGICLENAGAAEADRAFERLESNFHDLNEVRVSTIAELESIFEGMSDPAWRAMRVRGTLQYVFEKQFSFDFEGLRRKTLDLAAKQLARIKCLTPFVRDYTLLSVLGSHLVPADERMTRAAIWLGLAEPGMSPEQASEALKSSVRKADAPLLCQQLRQLATDPALIPAFDEVDHYTENDEEEFPYDLDTAVARLKALFEHGHTAKKPANKSAASTAASTGTSKPKTSSKTSKSKTAGAKTASTKSTKKAASAEKKSSSKTAEKGKTAQKKSSKKSAARSRS